MGTTTGVTSRVNIFDPIIKINGTDIGFIGDKLSVTYTQGIAKYESGIPKSLRKTVKNEEALMVKLDMMQTTLGNFQSAMNLPASSLVSTSIITVGGDRSTRSLTNVDFIGTDDQGKLIQVRMYTAVIVENGEWNVDNDFMKIPITIQAVADLSRATGDTLGFVLRES